MAESNAAGAERDRHPEIDWVAAERSPEFRELIKKRRNFVLPATIFFFVWYFGFILLAGYAPSFMGESVYEGFTVGYLLALTQFIMTWVLAGVYVRRSGREFDPLSRKAAETAVEAGRAAARGGRSDGDDTPTGPGEVTPR
jgi:uncharacterized membrane protein (DUF485 family)